MMGYLDWHVGMKVVCIKADGWKLSPGSVDLGRPVTFPQRGQVLTIRTMDKWCDVIYLRFSEIMNPLIAGKIEASFAIEWFRPLTKRDTSIEVFKQLLISPKMPVDA